MARRALHAKKRTCPGKVRCSVALSSEYGVWHMGPTPGFPSVRSLGTATHRSVVGAGTQLVTRRTRGSMARPHISSAFFRALKHPRASLCITARCKSRGNFPIIQLTHMSFGSELHCKRLLRRRFDPRVYGFLE